METEPNPSANRFVEAELPEGGQLLLPDSRMSQAVDYPDRAEKTAMAEGMKEGLGSIKYPEKPIDAQVAQEAFDRLSTMAKDKDPIETAGRILDGYSAEELGSSWASRLREVLAIEDMADADKQATLNIVLRTLKSAGLEDSKKQLSTLRRLTTQYVKGKTMLHGEKELKTTTKTVPLFEGDEAVVTEESKKKVSHKTYDKWSDIEGDERVARDADEKRNQMRGIGRYILFGDTIDGIYPVNSEAEEPIEPDEPGEPTPPPFPPIPPRPETPPPTPGTPEVPLPPTLTPWERAKEFARRKWRKLAIGTVIVALAIGLSGEDKGNPDAPDKTPTGTEQVDKDFTPPVIEDDRGGEDQEKETPEDPDKEESVFGVESYEMHIDKGHGITHELQEMGKDIFGYTMDSEELMDKYTRYKDVLDPIMGNYFTMMQGEWWGNTGYRYAGEQAEITGEDLDTLLAIIYEGHEAELQDAIEAGDIDINATALEQLKQRLQNR